MLELGRRLQGQRIAVERIGLCGFELLVLTAKIHTQSVAPSPAHGTGGWCLAGMANERERERDLSLDFCVRWRAAKRAESVSLLPNPVYVKPAGVDGAVRGGRLRQTAPETEAARHRPIDHFSAAWPKIKRNGWDGSFYPAPGRTVRGA